MAVGLTDVEPLPDCELKLPGEIEIVVAPLADQLSVLLPPVAILVGLAANELIEGTEAEPLDPELPEPLDPVLPLDPPVPLEPPELDEPLDPLVDVFVGLVVWPQAARPAQTSRAEISALRETCANRMAGPEKRDRIVDTPHRSLPLATTVAILAASTELVAVPWLGPQQEVPGGLLPVGGAQFGAVVNPGKSRAVLKQSTAWSQEHVGDLFHFLFY